MLAVQATDAPAAQVVGKKQLCEILGWSRPTLDARIAKDPLFPVVSRGGKGGGWEFDVGEVRAYLLGTSAARIDPAALEAIAEEDEERVVRFRPAGQTQTRGEETASARLKAAQAALQEDKLRKTRGELIDAGATGQVLAELMVNLRSELLNIPDQVGRDLDLTDRVVALMKRQTENALRTVVRTLKQKLAASAQPPEDA
jgi:phage terminase Nu1 subunit (DNA packaging protein)